MNDWVEEHIRTLVQLSGLTRENAKSLFGKSVYVAIDPKLRQNRTYRLAFMFAVNLLTRLFPATRYDAIEDEPLLILPWGSLPHNYEPQEPEAVLVFGNQARASNNPTLLVRANCHDWHIYVDLPFTPEAEEEWNPVLALSTACYGAARVAKVLLGDAIGGQAVWRPFSILDFESGSVRFDWSTPLDIGTTHLAGVGAIGSAALFSLAAHGAARGNLVILDHDKLDATNLGRYTFFTVDDVGNDKVLAAKARLDGLQLDLKTEAIVDRFEDFFDKKYSADRAFGVERLLSAPDRRDTRRQFQSKLPREVWDASTGPDQIVLHHNRFDPSLACLACIYPESPDEHAHARHVAEMLGIELERVLSGEPISIADAVRISERYPQFSREQLPGRAFDSVFRELCSAGRLRGADRMVLAPFSFISALAGVLLYFEFVKSLRRDVFCEYQQHKYTELNPFFQPNPEFRELRASRGECRCQSEAVRSVFCRLWKR